MDRIKDCRELRKEGRRVTRKIFCRGNAVRTWKGFSNFEHLEKDGGQDGQGRPCRWSWEARIAEASGAFDRHTVEGYACGPTQCGQVGPLQQVNDRILCVRNVPDLKLTSSTQKPSYSYTHMDVVVTSILMGFFFESLMLLRFSMHHHRLMQCLDQR